MKTKIFIITAFLLLAITIIIVIACKNTMQAQIVDFNVDDNGNLEIIYSDGSKKIINGVKAENGKDGVGISEASLNENGELILKYSNGESQNIGKITGADGINGTNGQVGSDGTDGVGISDIYLNTDKELIVVLTNGEIKNLGKIITDSTNSDNVVDAGSNTEGGWEGILTPQ